MDIISETCQMVQRHYLEIDIEFQQRMENLIKKKM